MPGVTREFDRRLPSWQRFGARLRHTLFVLWSYLSSVHILFFTFFSFLFPLFFLSYLSYHTGGFVYWHSTRGVGTLDWEPLFRLVVFISSLSDIWNRTGRICLQRSAKRRESIFTEQPIFMWFTSSSSSPHPCFIAASPQPPISSLPCPPSILSPPPPCPSTCILESSRTDDSDSTWFDFRLALKTFAYIPRSERLIH
ncbi:hypothetical protein BDQ94DRAFT_3127 [Aspergillus welwitschiae]|uniref:Uncharacterized protein n=1 Tax=Aspergillus welwitschiae TaxID=1341132 RepID=A0A3F3QK27_9EURO|nr:hypothetical protein BDQ94DRAFT_3127 [Aspergillus welwitschiae]RDH39202.1 hypothetical protein BDQ94DRAFT_3127 [Aspergillus welwitschiae]